MEASPADLILRWYDAEHRRLPWRAPPGGAGSDPYKVWLSEIMLQQTTVAAVIPYFEKFLNRWPTVIDLAAADLDDVLVAWAGLGYYARARNLHKCARVVAEAHGGRFPDDEDALRTLPGIGEYTAAAIAAIAFGRKANVVDGNVERVISRRCALTDPLPGVKSQIRDHAADLVPESRAGDYAQGLMDLGATLCTPRKPACGLCPWMRDCQGRIQGIATDLPARTPKAEKPTRRGIAFWIVRWDGAVLLRKRPPSGLLGGMMEIPSTPWREEPWPLDEAARHAPLKCDWRPLRGSIRHTFTHFHLDLTVVAGVVRDGAPTATRWVVPAAMTDEALPTVMRKIARHAQTQKS